MPEKEIEAPEKHTSQATLDKLETLARLNIPMEKELSEDLNNLMKNAPPKPNEKEIPAGKKEGEESEGNESEENENESEESEENESEENESEGEGESEEEESEEEGPEGKTGKEGKDKKEGKEKAEEIEIDSPLLGGKKKLGKKEAELKIEKFEDAKEEFKKVFGFEVNGVKELPKVFSAVKKMRTDAAKLPEAEKKATTLEGIIQGLPDEFLESIKAFYAGDRDYMKPLTDKPKLDFNKKVSDYDDNTLIKTYFPNKFTDEELNADATLPENAEKIKAKSIAADAAKLQYGIDKQGFDSKRTVHATKAQAQLKLKAESVKSSVENLKESFPEVADSTLKEVKSLLDSGDVRSLFFNPDGSYKKEAAMNLVMIRDGKQLIDQLMQIAENKGKTKATEDILLRTSEKADPVKKGGKAGKQLKISKEAQEKLDKINRLTEKKTTF